MSGEAGARFTLRVAEVVRSIPKGSVLSYGEVARRAGKPRGARAVATALRHLHGVPWLRVVRSDRTLAELVADEQGQLLRAEGHRIEGRRIVSSPGG